MASSQSKPRNLVVTGGGGGTRHDSTAAALKLPFIATPLGMMIIIPLLVGGAALAAVGLYRSAVQVGVRDLGNQRLEMHTALVRGRCLYGFEHATELLSRAHAWAEREPGLDDPARIARTLSGMVALRPGVSQLYIGTSDGGMTGVVLADGAWQLITVRPGPEGATRTLSQVLPDGSLKPGKVEERVAFDARVRPWYQQAVAAPGMIWTEPYRFSRTGLPGITLARQLPPAMPGQPARGVVAVDLDLASFGTVLQRPGDLGRNFLFTRNFEMLAMPPDLLKEVPAQGLPTGTMLQEPVAKAFFAAIPRLPEGDAKPLIRVTVDGVEHGGMLQAVTIPGGPTWYVALITTRDAVIGVMDAARSRGQIVALGAVLIGLLAGLYFARVLGRAKRQVEQERTRARAAEAKARELGSYNLIKKIGEGGMGQVWIGEHRMLSRPAAIKLISPAAMANVAPEEVDEIRKRFEQEARITASLRARSTVELYDFGVAPDGTFFYVMELLDGLDLRQLVEKHGPLPAGRAVHVLSNALTSLAEAHDRGLVHRDIKPENIFVCRRSDEVDVVKVLDFGLVRIAKAPDDARLTAAGMITGTPATMAPEQATGKDLDGRTDIYSLGCVACWLLTGSDAFGADSAIELLTKHINERPQPLRERNEAIPEELARLIEACLEKDPARRPPDARTLVQALEALVLPPGQAWTPRRAAAWWAQLPKREETKHEARAVAPTVVTARI